MWTLTEEKTFDPTLVRWEEGTKVKMSLDAIDKKAGMSLAELNRHTATLTGLAQANEADLANVKVTVLVNISGGVKQIIAEV